MAENQAREDIPEIHDQVKTDYPADHPSARDDPLFKRSVGELKEMLHKRFVGHLYLEKC